MEVKYVGQESSYLRDSTIQKSEILLDLIRRRELPKKNVKIWWNNSNMSIKRLET